MAVKTVQQDAPLLVARFRVRGKDLVTVPPIVFGVKARPDGIVSGYCPEFDVVLTATDREALQRQAEDTMASLWTRFAEGQEQHASPAARVRAQKLFARIKWDQATR